MGDFSMAQVKLVWNFNRLFWNTHCFVRLLLFSLNHDYDILRIRSMRCERWYCGIQTLLLLNIMLFNGDKYRWATSKKCVTFGWLNSLNSSHIIRLNDSWSYLNYIFFYLSLLAFYHIGARAFKAVIFASLNYKLKNLMHTCIGGLNALGILYELKPIVANGRATTGSRATKITAQTSQVDWGGTTLAQKPI